MTFINIIHQKIVLQLLIHAPLSSGSASTPAIWCSCLSETLDEEVDEGYEEERLAEEEHEGAYAVFLLCPPWSLAAGFLSKVYDTDIDHPKIHESLCPQPHSLSHYLVVLRC